MDSEEELGELKKSLEEERKRIAEEKEELEAERERYVKMALQKEEKIGEKITELTELKKDIESSVDEEETLSNIKDIMISALKKDSKGMIKLMKDLGLNKEDLKRVEAYLTCHIENKNKD